MADEQTNEIRRRLDEDLSLDEFERDYRSTGEAATQFFQDLFVQVLNFEETTSPLGDATWQDIPVHEWPNTARAKAARLFAESGNFRVIYVELEKLTRTAERNAIQSLTRSDRTSGWAIDGSFLTVFHAPDEDIWHLVTPYEEGTDDITTGRPVLRRYTLGEGETHRTVSNALSGMDASKGRLAERIDGAFRVKPVTEDFYEKYKSAFDTLSKELRRKGLEIENADRYAHTTLNRLMFFYYLQKKGWIADRKDFVYWFHEQYKETDEEDVFHEKWLSALFFDGMNSPEGGEIDADLPSEVESVISGLPYMNGGLFQPTEEDKRETFLSDSTLKSVIEEFLEQYNFTVTEESPYDIDVAVDPAMLGKIYESLIAEQERGEAGIFYTPRVEVDLMCRMALYEQFCNRISNVGETDKNLISEFIFTEPQDWSANKTGDTSDLEEILHDLTVVDPACGSGAFLVGMKQVLTELYRKLGEVPDYELNEQIINENIYGVDIKDWAIRVAEFRLWLSLMESEDDLPNQRPVLPNFTFKLRTGDSILQALNGGDISFKSIQREATGDVYRQLTDLEELKQEFYDGNIDLKEEIREKQTDVLIAHIDSRIESLGAETQTQQTFSGSETESSRQRSKEAKKQIETLKSLKSEIGDSDDEGFLWEQDFLEVMLDGGFDIVIGNPPYVRQEDIINQGLNPERVESLPSSEVKDLKKEYKSRLQSYVDQTFDIKPHLRSDLYLPFFFKGLEVLSEGGVLTYVTSSSWLDVGYGVRLQEGILRNSQVNRILDNRKQRTFVEADVNTVITSLTKTQNEMLSGDTAFCSIYAPYNEIVEADTMSELLVDTKTASSEIEFEGQPLTLNRTDDFRKISISEPSLWQFGGGSVSDLSDSTIQAEQNESVKSPKKAQGKYSTGKWGRFLRAPDAYFEAISKCGDQLERLDDITEIQRGIRSGANQFFYLPNKHFETEIQGDNLCLISNDTSEVEYHIPREYWMQKTENGWQPNFLLKNSRGFENPIFDEDSLDIGSSLRYVVIIDDSKDELDKETERYVEWGESHDTESCDHCRKTSPIPDSCSDSGAGWYDLTPMLRRGDILPMQNIDRRHAYWVPRLRTYIDQRLHGIEVPGNERERMAVAGMLNSTFGYMQLEINGRANLGQGALDVTTDDHGLSQIPSVENLSDDQIEAIIDCFTEVGNRKVGSVFEELGTESFSDLSLDDVAEDRRALDRILLGDILDLTESEQKALYQGFFQMVQNRLEKASSVE